jgi:hypothetical protein
VPTFRGQYPDPPEDEARTFTPEEQAAYEAGLDRVAEEKKAALADPGPGWKQWFLHDNSKWWFGLLFLIVDVWIADTWLAPVNLLGLVPSLAAAFYLEFVAYSYLWHRPSDEALDRRGPFRRRWVEPFEYGRWTPEADRVRAGLPLRRISTEGPDHRDFV